MSIAENIARVREEIARAAREAGRDPGEIVLVGASKMNDAGACRAAIAAGQEDIPAKVIRADGSVADLTLHVKGLTEDEKEIILDGCLMNYYAKRAD